MTERGPLDFDDGRDAPPPEPAPRPRPPAPPPARRPGAGRTTWVLGVVALVLIALVLVNSLRSEGIETGGPRAGGTLPPFAVPAADSSLQGDANVATEETKGTAAGERPACEVRGRDIVNICELAERGPVVLAVFPTDAERCRAVLDQFDRLAPAFRGRVTFVSVGSRGDRKRLRGHRHPVGWDADGAVATVYGLAGCPQITFAERGGRVRGAVHRPLADEALRRRAERLIAR
jgi:hypothetical protein